MWRELWTERVAEVREDWCDLRRGRASRTATAGWISHSLSSGIDDVFEVLGEVSKSVRSAQAKSPKSREKVRYRHHL